MNIHTSVNVWGGMVGYFKIGPHFFDSTKNGRLSLDSLENIFSYSWQMFLSTFVKGCGFYTTESWYVSDECEEEDPFNNQLNKIDFFVWGYVENLRYFSEINDFMYTGRGAK